MIESERRRMADSASSEQSMSNEVSVGEVYWQTSWLLMDTTATS